VNRANTARRFTTATVLSNLSFSSSTQQPVEEESFGALSRQKPRQSAPKVRRKVLSEEKVLAFQYSRHEGSQIDKNSFDFSWCLCALVAKKT